MRTMRLQGKPLDAWVARSAGLTRRREVQVDPDDIDLSTWHPADFHPSTDWSQGGPIVSAEWYDIEDSLHAWFGPAWPHVEAVRREPLLWFMRAYVAANYGEEVEERAPLDAAQRDDGASYQGRSALVHWASDGLRRLRLATGEAWRLLA